MSEERLRNRWGLIILAVLGAAAALGVVLADWLEISLVVSPGPTREETAGASDFGTEGRLFATGVALTAVLATAAVVVSATRVRFSLGLAGLATSIVTALVFPLVMSKVDEARLEAVRGFQ